MPKTRSSALQSGYSVPSFGRTVGTEASEYVERSAAQLLHPVWGSAFSPARQKSFTETSTECKATTGRSRCTPSCPVLQSTVLPGTAQFAQWGVGFLPLNFDGENMRFIKLNTPKLYLVFPSVSESLVSLPGDGGCVQRSGSQEEHQTRVSWPLLISRRADSLY